MTRIINAIRVLMGRKTSTEEELELFLNKTKAMYREANIRIDELRREMSVYTNSLDRLRKHSDEQQARIESLYSDLQDRRDTVTELRRTIRSMKRKRK